MHGVRDARARLWKRAPGSAPRVLGHRGVRPVKGGPSDLPRENTIQAFHRALTDGAEGIELDVRITADGHLVVIHDDLLPRAFDALRTPSRIRDLTLGQVRALPVAVPTLEEVLRFQEETGAWLNVELKRDVPSRAIVVRRLMSMLRAEDARRSAGDRILLSTFDPWMALALARSSLQIPVAWLVHQGQHVLRRAPGYELLGVDGVHFQDPHLPERRALGLLKAGAIVNVWTVNDPWRARELSELGVDALITDDPKSILAAVSERQRP